MDTHGMEFGGDYQEVLPGTAGLFLLLAPGSKPH